MKLINDLSKYATILSNLSKIVKSFGSTAGAMHVTVTLSGIDKISKVNKSHIKSYYLCANSGNNNITLQNSPEFTCGAEIPCTGAVLVVQKLAQNYQNNLNNIDNFINNNNNLKVGAYPCVSLFTLDEILQSLYLISPPGAIYGLECN
jgi:hypothetical protein